MKGSVRADDQQNLGADEFSHAIPASEGRHNSGELAPSNPPSAITASASRLPVENRDSGITQSRPCRNCGQLREEHAMGGRCIWMYNPAPEKELPAKSVGDTLTAEQVLGIVRRQRPRRRKGGRIGPALKWDEFYALANTALAGLMIPTQNAPSDD